MNQLILIITSCIRLSIQVLLKPVGEVRQSIIDCDEEVYQEMQKHGPLNHIVMFDKMKKYIAAVDELIKCLHSDKEGTYKVAKDVIDKKGAKFVQSIPWTWSLAQEVWGWDGRVIQDFLNYRMEVQEAWMDVEKYFDPTAYIPKELYTESYEESTIKP